MHQTVEKVDEFQQEHMLQISSMFFSDRQKSLLGHIEHICIEDQHIEIEYINISVLNFRPGQVSEEALKVSLISFINTIGKGWWSKQPGWPHFIYKYKWK